MIGSASLKAIVCFKLAMHSDVVISLPNKSEFSPGRLGVRSLILSSCS